MDIRNPHVTARSAEMHGARWRGGAPPGELKDASEVARSAAERAAAGVWGRSPRKISRFLLLIYHLEALLAIENSFNTSFLAA